MATERPAGTKNIVLRLDQQLAERLQTVADVEGRSVSDVLREAVAGLVGGQVFGPRSGEVALMAALQLLALEGREAGDLGPPATVRELLAGVAGGRVGIDELAAWLEQATGERRMEMFERFTDRAR